MKVFWKRKTTVDIRAKFGMMNRSLNSGAGINFMYDQRIADLERELTQAQSDLIEVKRLHDELLQDNARLIRQINELKKQNEPKN
jgi:septal ring factor EnvC (AmiA/AmiB activator)